METPVNLADAYYGTAPSNDVITISPDGKRFVVIDGAGDFPNVPGEIKAVADTLYEAIAHGDDEHRRWLREKADEIAPKLVTLGVSHTAQAVRSLCDRIGEGDAKPQGVDFDGTSRPIVPLGGQHVRAMDAVGPETLKAIRANGADSQNIYDGGVLGRTRRWADDQFAFLHPNKVPV